MLVTGRLALVPPSLSTGAEVLLSPWGEKDLAVLGNFSVGQCKRERSRTSDDSPFRRVLRPMARAHELIIGGGPWYDASQVGAHWSKLSNPYETSTLSSCNLVIPNLLTGIQTVLLKTLVLLDDQVSGISLETLSQRAVVGWL